MIPGSANPLLMPSAAGGYQVSRSLRFNSSDSGYCGRVPASAGNRTTWSFSAWIKRSQLGVLQRFFSGATATNGDDWTAILFNSSDQLVIGGYSTFFRTSNSVYRDCSAWYHLVITADLGNGTNALKLRAWINNVEVTWVGTSSNPSTTGINSANNHAIGAEQNPNNGYVGSYFNGYLADIYFIDGQALTPSSFTETDATTGQLIPKAYTGSYGTNGFHLEFADNSAATATTLGKDSSGLGNNWTPNNFSVTAGAGNDSLVDSPTNYGTDTGVGGEVRGNYCTLNPLSAVAYGPGTLSDGNLQLVTVASSTGYSPTRGTIAVSSGKWYWECVCTNSTPVIFGIGDVSEELPAVPGESAKSYGYQSDGTKRNNSAQSSYGATYGANDVVSVALDMDAGTVVFYKNNTSQGTAFSGLSGTFTPFIADVNSVASATIVCNFGQRPFAYTAPSGFKALCTQNLPAPLVTKPSTVMDVSLYTGNGSTQTISGLGFSPDWVWLKKRSGIADHYLYDQVRGATYRLYSNTTDAESTSSTGLTAFTSDGFSLGSASDVNQSSNTYAAWCWDAGTTTVTNTQGSITGGSQVRANATAGFSIVTYTADNSNTSTVGHGLGVKPALIIHKQRNNGTEGWRVYHISRTSNGRFLSLQGTAGFNSSTNIFPAEPTSTVFTPGNEASMNSGSYNCLAYCFAPVAGYSSFGSYVGNGSSDGPMVYTGMRPRWILIKNSSATADWSLFDTSRDPYNQALTLLAPNLSSADNVLGSGLDILSNGFKLRRDASPAINASGNTFIYAAFAEAPLNYSRAR